jgi:hypothetical protein
MQTIEKLRSGELNGTKHLKLSCHLTEFPMEIFSLAETLELLDLSANKLSCLPFDFGKLSKLKIVFFSDNLFTELPDVLSECRELEMIGFKSNRIEHVSESALPENTRWLILTNNKIRKLPSSIGNCKRLQKVALAGNQLTELPVEMANCKNLELLRISANQLTELPEWLLKSPKLSWLAFAGNPFSKKSTQDKPLEQFDWNDFELEEQLGEGASGYIYKAIWHLKTSQKEVAIKIFKGEVTSDGLPEDEMQACIAAGNHPNLVRLIGQIVNHPEKKHGLVMGLIPSSYHNLGMPPNFSTCTRDTFNEAALFTVQQIFKIAEDIAAAALQLHARGIMHGDLYAHNILIDNMPNSLMGDYGAASFYNKEDENATRIEQIESRAFGCLLDDLLTHLLPGEKHLPNAQNLMGLRDDCMQSDTEMRPVFSNILRRLQKLK